MSANSFVNGRFEKVPLQDEFDEMEMGFKNTPATETKSNGYHKYELLPTNLRVAKNGHFSDVIIEMNQEDDPKFPKETRKLLLAFLAAMVGANIDLVAMVLEHQKVPDRKLHPPLPDITFDNVTAIPWLFDVANVLVFFSQICFVSITALHRHRWILCRRIFLLLAVLYIYRSVTIFVTILPISRDDMYCSPKISESLSIGPKILAIVEEVFKFFIGQRSNCGDYIFSGHTIMLMMADLVVGEYIPKRHSFIHWLSWINAWVGMICLVVSRGHYTIDVILSYYITTRLFWVYHTFSNNADLKLYLKIPKEMSPKLEFMKSGPLTVNYLTSKINSEKFCSLKRQQILYRMFGGFVSFNTLKLMYQENCRRNTTQYPDCVEKLYFLRAIKL